MEKYYSICFHVNDNPETYAHNSRMLVGAEETDGARGILEEFKRRIDEEFDYDFSDIDLSDVDVYEGDIDEIGLTSKLYIDVESFFNTEKKIEQLADMLGIEAKEIEVSVNDNKFLTPEGTYTVMTESEAKEALQEEIKNFLECNSFTMLSHELQERALATCFDEEQIEAECKELVENEFYDRELEDVTADLDEDFIAKFTVAEKGVNISKLYEALADKRVEELKSEYDSLAQYIADEYGTEQIISIMNTHDNILDYEKLAEHHEALYDFNCLAYYDGEVNITENFSVFKQDCEDKRSLDFINGLESDDFEH